MTGVPSVEVSVANLMSRAAYLIGSGSFQRAREAVELAAREELRERDDHWKRAMRLLPPLAGPPRWLLSTHAARRSVYSLSTARAYCIAQIWQASWRLTSSRQLRDPGQLGQYP